MATSLWGSGSGSSDLNKNSPHRPLGSGWIRRGGLREVGVGGEWVLRSLKLKPGQSVTITSFCLWNHVKNSLLLLQHHVCMHAAMLSAMTKIN